MTGEKPVYLAVMKRHYEEIKRLDVPNSDISGVLDRVVERGSNKKGHYLEPK